MAASAALAALGRAPRYWPTRRDKSRRPPHPRCGSRPPSQTCFKLAKRVANLGEKGERLVVSPGAARALCHRRDGMGAVSNAAHLGIEVVAERFSLEHSVDGHFGGRGTGGGLNADRREPQPPLNDAAGQVDVLDPAIRDVGFAPPQQTLTFPDALLIEAKSHRPVSDVQNDHRDRKRRE